MHSIVANHKLKDIRKIIDENCALCELSKNRKNVVWGNGNQMAKVCFLGEGPGEDEDESGLAFVGRSGKKLTKILTFLNIDRNKDILILNCVKCRPPKNRNPKKEEIEICSRFLSEQLRNSPNIKTIVCLGKVPWTAMTGIEEPVIANRGKVMKHGKYNLVYTYHPSFLLRTNSIERSKEFIKDIKVAFRISKK